MQLASKTKSASSLDGARVLVADDEIMIALDIEATLAEAGADVVGPCTTLAQALRAAQNEPLSAATLDIRLGRETTDSVAKILAERGIPFLFYSGQTLPDNIRMQWPGCTAISKPVDQRTLVAAVAALLNFTP